MSEYRWTHNTIADAKRYLTDRRALLARLETGEESISWYRSRRQAIEQARRLVNSLAAEIERRRDENPGL